jgi:hypothetical protein
MPRLVEMDRHVSLFEQSPHLVKKVAVPGICVDQVSWLDRLGRAFFLRERVTNEGGSAKMDREAVPRLELLVEDMVANARKTPLTVTRSAYR